MKLQVHTILNEERDAFIQRFTELQVSYVLRNIIYDSIPRVKGDDDRKLFEVNNFNGKTFNTSAKIVQGIYREQLKMDPKDMSQNDFFSNVSAFLKKNAITEADYRFDRAVDKIDSGKIDESSDDVGVNIAKEFEGTGYLTPNLADMVREGLTAFAREQEDIINSIKQDVIEDIDEAKEKNEVVQGAIQEIQEAQKEEQEEVQPESDEPTGDTTEIKDESEESDPDETSDDFDDEQKSSGEEPVTTDMPSEDDSDVQQPRTVDPVVKENIEQPPQNDPDDEEHEEIEMVQVEDDSAEESSSIIGPRFDGIQCAAMKSPDASARDLMSKNASIVNKGFKDLVEKYKAKGIVPLNGSEYNSKIRDEIDSWMFSEGHSHATPSGKYNTDYIAEGSLVRFNGGFVGIVMSQYVAYYKLRDSRKWSPYAVFAVFKRAKPFLGSEVKIVRIAMIRHRDVSLENHFMSSDAVAEEAIPVSPTKLLNMQPMTKNAMMEKFIKVSGTIEDDVSSRLLAAKAAVETDGDPLLKPKFEKLEETAIEAMVLAKHFTERLDELGLTTRGIFRKDDPYAVESAKQIATRFILGKNTKFRLHPAPPKNTTEAIQSAFELLHLKSLKRKGNVVSKELIYAHESALFTNIDDFGKEDKKKIESIMQLDGVEMKNVFFSDFVRDTGITFGERNVNTKAPEAKGELIERAVARMENHFGRELRDEEKEIINAIANDQEPYPLSNLYEKFIIGVGRKAIKEGGDFTSESSEVTARVYTTVVKSLEKLNIASKEDMSKLETYLLNTSIV